MIPAFCGYGAGAGWTSSQNRREGKPRPSQEKSEHMARQEGPELVIGLVAPIGVDLDVVENAIENALATVNYTVKRIGLIRELTSAWAKWQQRIPDRPLDERYRLRMDAGDGFRELLDRGDALALFGMARIRLMRQCESEQTEKPIPRCAYLLRSLKTQEEVERLRETYRDNCIIVSAYSPKKLRTDHLAGRIAASRSDADTQRHAPSALNLMLRDEKDAAKKLGQDVRNTFPKADLFVNVSNKAQTRRVVTDFIHAIFGHPVKTPTRLEYGMFHAFGSALRSSAGRQVGAAITDDFGEVVALGTNEVAKAHGGQYWPEDGQDSDHRDYTRPNYNKVMMSHILADIFARLRFEGWLSEEYAAKDIPQLLDLAEGKLLKKLSSSEDTQHPPSLMDRALLLNIIEFLRAVHAEMAALMSAVRVGVSVRGCTLYSTTFPCHECARHIVAAGIKKVVFIEPYPKSRATELYDDSIEIDGSTDNDHVAFEAFVGVAPRQYPRLFLMSDRISREKWQKEKKSQVPRFAGHSNVYVGREREQVSLLEGLLSAKNLSGLIEGSNQ